MEQRIVEWTHIFLKYIRERSLELHVVEDEGLDVGQLQKLVGDYSYSGRRPRQQDYAQALLEKPRIRERSTILNRIASRFTRFIETFVDNI